MLEYYRFKVIHDLCQKGLLEEASLQLVELQRRYVALCDEVTGLKAQLQEYEDILYLKRNLQSDGRFYWLVTGSIKQGPFCPTCYEDHGLLTRLAGEPFARRCTYCCSYYRDSGDRPVTPVYPEEFQEFLPETDAPEFQSATGAQVRRAKVIQFRTLGDKVNTG